MAEIRNIIFDLAGVVLNLDLQRDTEALLSIGLPDFEGCLKDENIAVPMLAYLNGLKDADVFCDEIRPQCRANVTDEEILWAMDEVLDTVPEERVRLLIGLREKYRTFLLSNIYDTAWQHAVREIERHGVRVGECFERMFLSYEMGLAKPDSAIYQRVMEETGIVAGETLFLDDSRSNVEAAKSLGMQAYLVPMNELETVLQQVLADRCSLGTQ